MNFDCNKNGVFSMCYPQYFERSIPVVPINFGTKGTFAKDWTIWSDKPQPIELVEYWDESFPQSGIGLILGPQSGIVAGDLDLDLNDPYQVQIYDRIKHLIPESPLEKVGKKGFTRFYRFANELSWTIRHENLTVFEMLSVGRQTVLPPTIHPELKRPYVWTNDYSLLDIDLTSLPLFPPGNKIEIEKVLMSLKSAVKSQDKRQCFGRNDALKSQSIAALLNGKADELIASEIHNYDLKFHNPPLFSDVSDLQMRGREPMQNALRFVQSIRRSTSKNTNPNFLSDVPVENIRLHIESTDWVEVSPLSPLISPDPFDPNLIPDSWRPWIEDVANRAGCQLEMVYLPAIAAFATAIGRSAIIRPKRLDKEWKCFMSNLWCMVLAPSGSKKSPAFSAAMAPLVELELEAEKHYRETLAANKGPILTLEAQKAQLEQLSKKSKTQNSEEIQKIEAQLKDLQPSRMRFVTQEATTQAIVKILQDNPFGLGVSIDELSGFFKGLERENRQSDRAFYLTAWNGNQLYNVDTVSRGNNVVPKLYLVVLGTIQPEVFGSYVSDQIKSHAHADGLLPRFQLIANPQRGVSVGMDIAPNELAKNFFHKTFRFAAGIRNFIAMPDEAESEAIEFSFDEESQELFNSFAVDLEQKINEEDGSELVQGYLAKQRSTMPILAMFFQLLEIFHSSATLNFIEIEKNLKISKENTILASKTCDWLQKNAVAVYKNSNGAVLKSAHSLVEKIVTGKLTSGLTARDILDKKWANLTQESIFNEALNLLIANGYLKIEEKSTGGRPKKEIIVNPKISINSNGGGYVK